MKKFMMMAVMLVASATAFAGDSDALKEILKAKIYADAEALVKSNIDLLASPEEKAKAYNKLVDLAMEIYSEQNGIVIENQMKKQMNPDAEEKPVDRNLMYGALCNAIEMAMECDKYDQVPNAKGKISPKFQKKNAERLWPLRPNLVNEGDDARHKEQNELVLRYWGIFLDSDDANLFNGQDKTQESEYIGQVAYLAGDYAHKAGLLDKAKKYFTICANDEKVEEQYKNAAHAAVLNMMKEGLKDKADTLRVLNEYKEMYSQKPDDDLLMDVIYNLYGDLKDKDAQKKILDERLANDPNNFIALADKGFMAMQDNNASEAADYLLKASEIQPQNVVVLHYLGMCLNAKAIGVGDTNPAQAKDIFKQAIDVYDKCKELDPDMMQVKWGYNRYQSYYNYYGEDAPETKQAEADSKY